MMTTKQLISELQGHFTERGRLEDAKNAIKVYTKESSFYFSYKDGWGNKKYINLPFTPDDVLPILQKYIDNIERDIIYSSVQVEIDSEDNLMNCLIGNNECDPDRFVSVEFIKDELRKAYAHRTIIDGSTEDNVGDDNFRDKPYHIKRFISSKIFYEFWLIGRCKNTLMFGFNGFVENGGTTETDTGE